ncbi:hypothetical protein H6F90_12200 [Trichocoleus sp. FACHB-591]|uniref:hypothetical protein n=1 Tax=Trichocoleus sp. FACHB-591 TaxID=2692872 RepID=UPI00168590D8|nr:hypothetical protein [Trichocoleus sp. FACHB-591]MBD2095909.1 hypothetical protein [Trichocoleus sp. FACHB-591]
MPIKEYTQTQAFSLSDRSVTQNLGQALRVRKFLIWAECSVGWVIGLREVYSCYPKK